MPQKNTDSAAAVTPGADEWGIPNWRDTAAYGNVDQWDDFRWRWEFYRRRDDLRDFFDRWANHPEVLNLRCNAGRAPNDTGFLAFGRFAEKGEAIERFDYGGVPNPRISDQPKGVLIPASRFFHRTRFFNPKTRKPDFFSVGGVLGERPMPSHYNLHLFQNEYAIKFDLNIPLNPQVQEAQAILKKAQIKLHGKLVHRKKLKDKWFDFLRILDARAEDPNASWQVFTDALYEVRLVDRHTNDDGGYRAPPPQAGRDRWEAANTLRYNF